MNSSGINCLVLDIDGVLTDGTVSVAHPGDKRLFLRDLDALTRFRARGGVVAFLTGEGEADAAAVVARCGGGQALYGAKDKERGIDDLAAGLNIPLEKIAYIGDARRDIPALRRVGLSLCPADADPAVRDMVQIVLKAPGGRGAVTEAVDILMDGAAGGNHE